MYEEVKRFIETVAAGEKDPDVFGMETRGFVFPASWVSRSYHETKNYDQFLAKIRQWKKEEIGEILHDLTVYVVTYDEILTEHRGGDFRALAESLRRQPHPTISFFSNLINTSLVEPITFVDKHKKRIEGTTLAMSHAIPDGCPDGYEYYFFEHLVRNRLDLMLMTSYDPPGSPDLLHRDLFTMFLYYCLPFDSCPILTDIVIDSAVAKASYRAG
ncbi:MAG: hypothetical protein JSV01_07265, partial [Desulfobacterales bacterium]